MRWAFDLQILLRILFSLDDIKFDAAFWKKAEKSRTQKFLEFLGISKEVGFPVMGLQCHHRLNISVLVPAHDHSV